MNSHFRSVANIGRLITALGVYFLISNSLPQEKLKPPPVIPPDLLLPAKDFDVVEMSLCDLNGFPLNPNGGVSFETVANRLPWKAVRWEAEIPAEWLSGTVAQLHVFSSLLQPVGFRGYWRLPPRKLQGCHL